jgi:hypothetical protein
MPVIGDRAANCCGANVAVFGMDFIPPDPPVMKTAQTKSINANIGS